MDLSGFKYCNRQQIYSKSPGWPCVFIEGLFSNRYISVVFTKPENIEFSVIIIIKDVMFNCI